MVVDPRHPVTGSQYVGRVDMSGDLTYYGAMTTQTAAITTAESDHEPTVSLVREDDDGAMWFYDSTTGHTVCIPPNYEDER